MVKILKVAYLTQRWVRGTTWISLLLGSLIFFRLTGGFPPHGWQVLASGIANVSALWASHGPSVLLPLFVLCIYSLLLLLIWLFLICAMLWAAFQQWNYLRTWRHVERVARTVQHEDAYTMQQSAAEWQSSKKQDGRTEAHNGSTPSPFVMTEDMWRQDRGTDAHKGFQTVWGEEGTDVHRSHSTSVGERTDAHKGPLPPSTHAPVPTMYETAGTRAEIVGTGDVGKMGEAPCGRPSSPIEKMGGVPDVRPSSPIEKMGEDSCVRPSSFPPSPIEWMGDDCPPLSAEWMNDHPAGTAEWMGEGSSSSISPPSVEWMNGVRALLPTGWMNEEHPSPESSSPVAWMNEEHSSSDPFSQQPSPGPSQPVGASPVVPITRTMRTVNLNPPPSPLLERAMESQQMLPQGGVSTLSGPFTQPLVPRTPITEPQPTAQEGPVTLRVGTGLDAGITRREKPNEDHLLAVHGTHTFNADYRPYGLFVVADGMGGHANGQEASRLVIQHIRNAIIPTLLSNVDLDSRHSKELLLEGIQHANLAIYQQNRQQGSDMGSTITSAILVGSMLTVANVGDSRTYLYTPQKGLSQVTHDHSMVARMVEKGIIRAEEIYTHPQRNQIYRCLGENASVQIDAFSLSYQPGDTLLLCSDGLWEMVRDVRIEEILRDTLPDAALATQTLVRAALEGGGKDNISAIVVHRTGEMLGRYNS